MKKVLVDSSVWIDYFKRTDKKNDPLTSLIDENCLCINELILAELIPAIKQAKEEELAELLHSIERLPLKIDWTEIIGYQCHNLKRGINRVSLSDIIILQNVIQNKAMLFTFDKHFYLMSKLFKFDLYNNGE